MGRYAEVIARAPVRSDHDWAGYPAPRTVERYLEQIREQGILPDDRAAFDGWVEQRLAQHAWRDRSGRVAAPYYRGLGRGKFRFVLSGLGLGPWILRERRVWFDEAPAWAFYGVDTPRAVGWAVERAVLPYAAPPTGVAPYEILHLAVAWRDHYRRTGVENWPCQIHHEEVDLLTVEEALLLAKRGPDVRHPDDVGLYLTLGLSENDVYQWAQVWIHVAKERALSSYEPTVQRTREWLDRKLGPADVWTWGGYVPALHDDEGDEIEWEGPSLHLDAESVRQLKDAGFSGWNDQQLEQFRRKGCNTVEALVRRKEAADNDAPEDWQGAWARAGG